jgi:mycothiol synthase
MLNIRRFVKGIDEPLWVDLLNAARKDREDWRAVTKEELLAETKRPGFDYEGRFIGELDGKAIGIVHARVDKSMEDKKGFVHLDVVPEFRSCGIETPLVETALRELKARGMTIAQTWTDITQKELVELFEGLHFKHIRVFSVMEMELSELSQNIGESKQVSIRPLRKELEDDIRLFNWLGNESYKEDLDYSPNTLEETRHFLFRDLYLKQKEVFFAMLDGESVGCVGIGIDEKYNLEKQTQAGEVFVIGVLKAHRRKGIGARLMLHGLERLKTKGMTRAILGVEDENLTQAKRLYEKLGFRVKKREIILERDLVLNTQAFKR